MYKKTIKKISNHQLVNQKQIFNNYFYQFRNEMDALKKDYHFTKREIQVLYFLIIKSYSCKKTAKCMGLLEFEMTIIVESILTKLKAVNLFEVFSRVNKYFLISKTNNHSGFVGMYSL